MTSVPPGVNSSCLDHSCSLLHSYRKKSKTHSFCSLTPVQPSSVESLFDLHWCFRDQNQGLCSTKISLAQKAKEEVLAFCHRLQRACLSRLTLNGCWHELGNVVLRLHNWLESERMKVSVGLVGTGTSKPNTITKIMQWRNHETLIRSSAALNTERQRLQDFFGFTLLNSRAP